MSWFRRSPQRNQRVAVASGPEKLGIFSKTENSEYVFGCLELLVPDMTTRIRVGHAIRDCCPKNASVDYSGQSTLIISWSKYRIKDEERFFDRIWKIIYKYECVRVEPTTN